MSKNSTPTIKKPSLFDRFLNRVEVVGNKLPHPIALFFELAVFMVILSAICSAIGLSATGTVVSGGELVESTVTAVSLLTGTGLAWMLTSFVSNFTDFAPLGVVLVAMLGVGVAEDSGLINAALKRTVQITPAKFITPVIVFVGVMSNIASNAGYVILIPLGAMVFRIYGRHPIAGLAAAFAGVSGGFSANLIIGSLDPLLAGITQEAAYFIDDSYTVNVMGNFYFMFVSTFIITAAGTFITDKIVEPRLGKFDESQMGEEDTSLRDFSDDERKGLRNAGFTVLAFIVILVACCIPSNSFLRNTSGEFLSSPTSPLIDGIIVLIMLFFLLPAIAFGFSTKKFKGSHDICMALCKAMATMGPYVALSAVAAQFIAYFSYTKLGTILAIKGANLLGAMNVGLIPLMVAFVILSAFINLFLASSSAKWNIMAPVFIPMFMYLGYSPELAQLAYRIGDSCTNLITPLLAFFAVIIMNAQKYDKKAGMGTLIATMLPYSIGFMIAWTILIIVWLTLGLPIGPGTELFYTMGA